MQQWRRHTGWTGGTSLNPEPQTLNSKRDETEATSQTLDGRCLLSTLSLDEVLVKCPAATPNADSPTPGVAHCTLVEIQPVCSRGDLPCTCKNGEHAVPHTVTVWICRWSLPTGTVVPPEYQELWHGLVAGTVVGIPLIWSCMDRQKFAAVVELSRHCCRWRPRRRWRPSVGGSTQWLMTSSHLRPDDSLE